MTEALRRTPLYEEHLLLGGKMVPFAGYEMPVEYAGIIEEHTAVRESAGVFDVCHMAQFRVFGFESFNFLQSLLTNDLSRISTIGTAQYTLLCDEDGGIIDDLIVYHSGDLEYLIIANSANRDADWDWLVSKCPENIGLVHDSGQEPIDDCSVEMVDESERTGLVALQGPKAISIITELAGAGFEPPTRFSLGEALLDGVPVLIARTGYTGEDGVEILCQARRTPEIWRMLLSFPDVTPCGLGARDTLRLEMGYPLHGSDMDRGVDPISAGLGWTVSREKTEFIGAEAIAKVRSRGPEKRLVGLMTESGIPRPGYSVLREGKEVGKVASGTYSPTLGRGIATAYLPTAMTEAGTEVEVAIRKKTVKAVVEKLPFVKETSLSAVQA